MLRHGQFDSDHREHVPVRSAEEFLIFVRF
jgi:hypothetical protein